MTATASGRSSLRDYITPDGVLLAPCKDCNQPMNRQLKREPDGSSWMLKGRPRYCEACRVARAKASTRKDIDKRVAAKSWRDEPARRAHIGGELKWVRDCLECGTEFVSKRVPGRKGTKHCDHCITASWACRHCGCDTRQTSRSADAAYRRGHRLWPKQWPTAQCDGCKGKTSRRDRVASILSKIDERKTVTATPSFYYHHGCQACGNPKPFMANGMNVGCTDKCTSKITRDVHQYRRRLAFRNAQRVELVMPGRVYARDRGICQICNVPVPPPGAVPATSANSAQLDHIVPMSDPHFGDHTYDNMQLTHAMCNLKRQVPRSGASYRQREVKTRVA